MENSTNSSLLAKILTWTIIGVLAIVAIKVALWLAGFALGVLGLVLTFALPLAVIAGLAWIAVKAVRAFRKSPTY